MSALLDLWAQQKAALAAYEAREQAHLAALNTVVAALNAHEAELVKNVADLNQAIADLKAGDVTAIADVQTITDGLTGQIAELNAADPDPAPAPVAPAAPTA